MTHARTRLARGRTPRALTPAPSTAATETTTLGTFEGSGAAGSDHNTLWLGAKAAPVEPDPRTIRVISSWVQAPRFWRADVARFSRGYRDGSRPDLHGGDAVRIRQAAATAALWGVPVGLITGVREEAV